MKLPGVPYQPKYTSDETVVGIIGAFVVHVSLPAFVWLLSVLQPATVCKYLPMFCPKDTSTEVEKPPVSRPVVQASLLKLGKPVDPKKLPDRVVPQQRTAPKKQITASREDPGKKPDAGAPPPEQAKDDDLKNLVKTSDPFAEKPKATRPEEGHESGIDGGQETDPNKVRAGDMYVALLGEFFGKHLTLPSIITPAQESKLCSVFQVTINRGMVIWHVRMEPVKGSGNELFDDAARTMLLKLRDDKTKLPEPPKESEDQFRGRAVNIAVQGKNGDPSRCK